MDRATFERAKLAVYDCFPAEIPADIRFITIAYLVEDANVTSAAVSGGSSRTSRRTDRTIAALFIDHFEYSWWTDWLRPQGNWLNISMGCPMYLSQVRIRAVNGQAAPKNIGFRVRMDEGKEEWVEVGRFVLSRTSPEWIGPTGLSDRNRPQASDPDGGWNTFVLDEPVAFRHFQLWIYDNFGGEEHGSYIGINRLHLFSKNIPIVL
eukprot:TRINITY_DN3970_c0_g2_i1.p1 TRINITY_DN3970_c0_g2~~TRINITY_DN3970_c0_g2_i1.p1  ORF type:complete len:207 (+),score=30.54 TRINITY_DN3970_c0_g2_i1:89-709(+)